MTSVLIVGASQAGVQVASSLRDLGHDGQIVLAGGEDHLPYQRPPLSKAYLLGTADEATLTLRAQSFFDENRIDLRRSTWIREVTTSAVGGTALTGDGTRLEFDVLVLATGAGPRKLPVSGSDLRGVLYMRNLSDAQRLRDEFTSVNQIVVIGGGFIGLEAAAVARIHGKEVTVVEAAPNLLARVSTPLLADFYQHAHERRGVRFHLGAAVSSLVGSDGRVTGVELDDGTLVPADLVLVGVGVSPRSELAGQLGATSVDGAILVDERCQTSVANVLAAGDCTIGPNPVDGETLVRLESVQNAVDQAKVVASTIVGGDERYRGVPWFWSDQGDIKLQMAGLSQGYDAYTVRGDIDSEHFSLIYSKSGKFIAISSVNRAVDYVVGRSLLAKDATLDFKRAADDSIPLKECAVEKP